MPVLIRNYTDDEAVIVMVDSNIQRENLLPSEKAYAYKMKMDAVKHQGIKRKTQFLLTVQIWLDRLPVTVEEPFSVTYA